MKFTTLWHFARLLSKREAYKEKVYDDGHTAAAHYSAWSNYVKEFCRRRSQQALFVEMADGTYNAHSLKGLYNVYDFTEDERLKQVSGDFLTLYYASWAQEQIDGVRGGGKSRMNGRKNVRTKTPITNMMWFYLGMGDIVTPHGEYFTIMTSEYRLPDVVMDMVLDVEGRGNYEIADCPPGLAVAGYHGNPLYRLRDDYGGIVRYSWSTPDFVMGLPVVEARPIQDWTLISSQSRWQGVIFAGEESARIFPECKPENEGGTFNQQWGIQKKGSMISQRLKDEFTRGTEGMKVWVDGSLGNRGESEGWVFVEAQGAYAAVRPARGGYRWNDSEVAPKSGSWITFEEGYSPAIIEVAQKSDFADYETFRQAVISLPVVWGGDELHYTGLSGDKFVFHADYSGAPKINGETFDYSPEKVFNSPFIRSKRNSGIVKIAKDARELVLDFSASPSR